MARGMLYHLPTRHLGGLKTISLETCDEAEDRVRITSKRRSPWLCPAPSGGAGLFFSPAPFLVLRRITSPASHISYHLQTFFARPRMTRHSRSQRSNLNLEARLGHPGRANQTSSITIASPHASLL